MSNGEVRRWKAVASIKTRSPFVSIEYVEGDVVSACDHDRIVAELKVEIETLEETIATQKRVIEKLKGMVSHYETCATVDRYDDEEVPCDCGLEKELAAIDKGEA